MKVTCRVRPGAVYNRIENGQLASYREGATVVIGEGIAKKFADKLEWLSGGVPVDPAHPEETLDEIRSPAAKSRTAGAPASGTDAGGDADRTAEGGDGRPSSDAAGGAASGDGAGQPAAAPSPAAGQAPKKARGRPPKSRTAGA